jgi:hypothetical protein
MNDITEVEFPIQLEDVPVKIFKLISGESIIAYTHEFDDDDEDDGFLIAIEEPMNIVVDNEHQYVFTPWLPFAANSLHYLKEYDVLLSSDVQTDVKAYYMRTVLDAATDMDNRAIEHSNQIRGNSTTH